ncbi:MAG: flagellar motor protein MotB [Rhodothalassiaceae bacterium]|nr:MAG: flagellar motor protein MotB [Rhodothalassiaceae bacterium]
MRRARGEGEDISWPGFVDALSTLLLVLVFLLSLFALSQFFLGNVLSGRDKALAELRAQLAQMSEMLSLEKRTSEELRRNLAELTASLQAAEGERDALKKALEAAKEKESAASARLADLERKAAEQERRIHELETELGARDETLAQERARSARQRSQIVELQAALAALREQLARLEAALEAAEKKDKEQQAIIADLGRRLNVALAQKVEELAGYRSEFFGRLRQILGDRPDIRVVGDRFVLQAELLFPTASAEIGPEGREELRKVAAVLKQIATEIPPDIDWILRVDGHTDRRPIHTPQFRDNWDLSAARAVAVVRFLISEGVPPGRLAAAAFAQYQPVAEGDDPESLARNRRIEFRFTQR